MGKKRGSYEQRLSIILSEFARDMVANYRIPAILDHLVERIVDLLPITAAGVTLISLDEDPPYVAASDDSAFSLEQLQTELSEGPRLLAHSSGQTVAIPDLRTEQRFPNFTQRALQDGLRAVLTFPLRQQDHQLGALNLYLPSPGGLSAPAMAAAQTLADVAAAHLINAKAREVLEASSNRSRELALHDGLTGLPNRMLLLERMEHAFQRSCRTGKTSAVIYVDLDNFKAVNDTHGHGVGNQLLVAIAMRLRRVLRPPDTIARLHGDEFVVLCEDLDDPIQAGPILDRLSDALRSNFQVGTARIAISASVGIAFAGPDMLDAEQILRKADAAMYHAKRQGSGLLGLPHGFNPRHVPSSDNRQNSDDERHSTEGERP